MEDNEFTDMDGDGVDDTQQIQDTIKFLKNIRMLDGSNKERVDTMVQAARSAIRTTLMTMYEQYRNLQDELRKDEEDDKKKEHLKNSNFISKAYFEKFKRYNQLLDQIKNFLVYEQEVLFNYARIYKNSFNLDKHLNIQAEVMKQLEQINSKYTEMMKTQMDKTIEMHEKDTEKHFGNIDKAISLYSNKLDESVKLVAIALHRITEVLVEVKPKLIEHTSHLREEYNINSKDTFAPTQKQPKQDEPQIAKLKEEHYERRYQQQQQQQQPPRVIAPPPRPQIPSSNQRPKPQQPPPINKIKEKIPPQDDFGDFDADDIPGGPSEEDLDAIKQRTEHQRDLFSDITKGM